MAAKIQNGWKKHKNIQKSQYNSKTFIDNSIFNSLLERHYDWNENQVENNFIFRTNMASKIQNGRKGRISKLNLFKVTMVHGSINPSKKFIGTRISRFTVQSIGASNRYRVYLVIKVSDFIFNGIWQHFKYSWYFVGWWTLVVERHLIPWHLIPWLLKPEIWSLCQLMDGVVYCSVPIAVHYNAVMYSSNSMLERAWRVKKAQIVCNNEIWVTIL